MANLRNILVTGKKKLGDVLLRTRTCWQCVECIEQSFLRYQSSKKRQAKPNHLDQSTKKLDARSRRILCGQVTYIENVASGVLRVNNDLRSEEGTSTAHMKHTNNGHQVIVVLKKVR